jgi:hypothetical protein
MEDDNRDEQEEGYNYFVLYNIETDKYVFFYGCEFDGVDYSRVAYYDDPITCKNRKLVVFDEASIHLLPVQCNEAIHTVWCDLGPLIVKDINTLVLVRVTASDDDRYIVNVDFNDIIRVRDIM